MEAAVDEKCFGIVLRHDVLRHRTHTPVAPRPIDEHKLTAGLQDALHFCKEAFAVLDLEERIGEYDCVERCIAQMRAARLLDVAPDRFNDALMLFVRSKLDVFQDIFLYIDGIDLAAVADDGCRRARA